MHPHLDKERFRACIEFIDALEACHKEKFYKKFFGYCNFEKNQLSKCLHFSRISDLRSKVKKTLKKEKLDKEELKKTDELYYGKNCYLKEIMDLEIKSRLNKEQNKYLNKTK